MGTYLPSPVQLPASFEVAQDGEPPDGAVLGGQVEVVADGVCFVQGVVAPLAGSGNITRTGWRWVAAVPGADAGMCGEFVDLELGSRPVVKLIGRGAAGWWEIYPPHGQMLRKVAVTMRNDIDGPGSTAPSVTIYEMDLYDEVDLGGDIGPVPVMTQLATADDPSADETAMREIHNVVCAIADDGHQIDRTTCRYFVKVVTGSGTNTTASTLTWVHGARIETRIPAGGTIDQGAG